MSVWNISANYVLVPLKFNLNWNIWKPFLKTSPLDLSGLRLGNTSLVVFLRFHSFSQVVKWPEFVRLYTSNISHVQCQTDLTGRGPLCLREVVGSLPIGTSVIQSCFTFQFAFYQAKLIILQKILNQNYKIYHFWLSLAHGPERCRVLRLEKQTGGPLCYVVLNTFDTFFWNNIYEVWWVFYPGNIFLVDLYHETLGPGVSMGSYPFPFGIKFFYYPCENPFF